MYVPMTISSIVLCAVKTNIKMITYPMSEIFVESIPMKLSSAETEARTQALSVAPFGTAASAYNHLLFHQWGAP